MSPDTTVSLLLYKIALVENHYVKWPVHMQLLSVFAHLITFLRLKMGNKIDFNVNNVGDKNMVK
jgi:hypothetical protein